jgi:molybdate transport system substrate-binding protein
VSKRRLVIVLAVVVALAALNLVGWYLLQQRRQRREERARRTAAESARVIIAAASDLNPVLSEIARDFEAETGHSVQITYGASGSLFAQIQNGAPFDVFLSANLRYPRELIAAGHAEQELLAVFAVGKLVLWVPRDSPLDLNVGLDALIKAGRVVIANPQHAPYGAAAAQALERSGLYKQLQPRLVLAENVAQAAQFVHSGNADAGLISLATAMSPEMRGTGRYLVVPPELYSQLTQAAVLVKGRRRNVAATKFLLFLHTDRAAQRLRDYGFEVPR